MPAGNPVASRGHDDRLATARAARRSGSSRASIRAGMAPCAPPATPGSAAGPDSDRREQRRPWKGCARDLLTLASKRRAGNTKRPANPPQRWLVPVPRRVLAGPPGRP